MSGSSTLKTPVDLPVLGWTRFARSASAAASCSCAPKNGVVNPQLGRYVYYLQASAVFQRYDTWTDSWEVLTPPTTALLYNGSMTYLESYGWEGRVLAATATTFTGPGLTSKALAGYDVEIVSGTGA